MKNTDLKKIGISTQDYQVYKALLEYPLATVSGFAKWVGTTRVTLYKVLALLEKKGVI